MREFGYSGYHRQLEFEMLADLQPVDAVDATALRPGTHRVEITDVRYSGAGVRVRFTGTGRRTHVHNFPRDEWEATGLRLGKRIYIHLVRSAGADLYRTTAGTIVGLGADGRLICGPYPNIEAARRNFPIARTVLSHWNRTT